MSVLDSDGFVDMVATSAKRHKIPGLSAAFIRGDTVRCASSGVLNVSTRVAVTDDSVFQVGSIAKVFTGTLVMQLVDEGMLELDAPIRRYLPQLRIANEPISDAVTVRRLLTHTSGIVGDLFLDTGRNDEATALYVDRCSDLPYLTEPGRYFSYCNSGFNILGRAIEVITKQTWAARLHEALLAPLWIAALVDAEDAPRYRTAVGHVLDGSGDVQITPTCFLPRGCEAAGSRLAMSPASLLGFARLHLRDGVAPNGRRLLSAQAARAMRELEVRLPIDIGEVGGWGLSWQILDSWKPRTVGHDGGTVGQTAFLRVIPEWDVAVAALTNISSGGPRMAFDEIVGDVLGAIGETNIPHNPAPNGAMTIEAERFVGIYETHLSRFEVEASDGTLRATVSQRNNESIGDLPAHHLVLRPIDGDRFIAEDEPYGAASVVGFTDYGKQGKARFLFSGLRLAERVRD